MKKKNTYLPQGVRVFKRMMAASALSLCMISTAPAAPNWPNAPFSYYANNEDLPSLLRNFAGGFSLSLDLSPKVTGVVNGKFNTNSPTEFLDRLGGVYGFNWFVYAGTLFISRASDMTTRSISASGVSISNLYQALYQLGVLDTRFGWGELPDQSMALVSGPPAYVDLIARTVAQMPQGSGGQQVAVFKLKHASVSDRSVDYRDQKVVTPGLATVLRNVITGTGGGANNETLSSIAAPLRAHLPSFGTVENGSSSSTASGDSAPANTPAAAVASRAGMTSGGGTRTREPSVQADTRLNAIIVQDIPERLPIYKRLIEELDVPSTLIEIEAMIVDVNSDNVSELGVTWGARAGTTSFGYGDLGMTPSTGLPVDSSVAISQGTIGVSVGNMLAIRLRALQNKGKANILSQPSILTSDNLGAMIDLSDTFYIQTKGERVATVTPVTVGTSLRVTPRFIDGKDGGQVELTVDIEDGSILTQEPVGELPTVRKSNISTLAVVGNEQTLLIGGHNKTTDAERVEKVPLLGDIPLLGAFFSNKSKNMERRERLFLIRPRVVAINGEMVTTPGAYLQSGSALNTTWGKDAQPTAGQYLDLMQGQRTRVIFSDAASLGDSRQPIGVAPESLPLGNMPVSTKSPATSAIAVPAGVRLSDVPVIQIGSPPSKH